MAKRSKLAPRTKAGSAKTKAAARRRLATRKRKPPLRPRLKVGDAKTAGASNTARDTHSNSAIQALGTLLSSLPSLALGAAAPAIRKTEQTLGQIDIASFIGALTAAMPDTGTSGNKKLATKSAKRQIAEEAALLAAAIALIALRRKLPLKKIVGSGVPGNVLSLLGALRSLRK